MLFDSLHRELDFASSMRSMDRMNFVVRFQRAKNISSQSAQFCQELGCRK